MTPRFTSLLAASVAALLIAAPHAGAQAISSLNPNTAPTGSADIELTINGQFFPQSLPTVNWTFQGTTTTLQSGDFGPTAGFATVPASLLTVPGIASVTVAQGSSTSNSASFTITGPPLTLNNISPNSALAGGPAFTLAVSGSNYYPGAVVTWNGSPLDTAFMSPRQLSASVPAILIANAGTASVSVVSPGQASPQPLPFTIIPPLGITSLAPNTAVAGGPSFALTVNGSGFNQATVVTWNGIALGTLLQNSGQLAASVLASLITSPGTASVTVTGPGQPSPPPLPFTITTGASTLTSLVPNNAVAGGPSFNLTVNGAGFTANSIVTWNGSPLTTSFVSTGQLNAVVPPALIVLPGAASVTVVTPGQTSPSSLPFTITSAPLTLTSIAPNTAVAGGPSLNMTVSGSGFNGTTIVTWNGSQIATTFVSGTQLTAAVPATLIATAGSASVTVVSQGQTSPPALPFTITPTNQTLTLTSIAPNTAVVGGSAFTLTANGSGFSAATVVTWNGSPLSTTFVSTGQLTAAVPANLIATVGTASVAAQNGSQTSNTLPFTITSAALTLTSISPTSAAVGGPAFTLIANGTGFNANTFVTWNGTALPTTFVSASQLNASVSASLIAAVGTASVAAQNGSQTSAALSFAITLVPLTLTGISPSSVAPGGPDFTLTVTGTAFTPATVVTWNGTPLATTFISSTQLSAAVPANLIASAGTASIDVTVPNQVSPPPLSLNINTTTPSLTITTITPGTVPAGSAAFTLLVDGTGFNGATTVFWNATALTTTFLNTTQMNAVVPASLLVQPGSASITAQNVRPAQVSNAVTFNISAGTLTLTSISPNIALAGDAAFTLTANGTGFTANTQVTWNGTALTTTFVSTTQLTASVPASLIATAGTASVGVTSPTPAIPAPLPFTITNFGLTSLSPATAIVGGRAFVLIANGSGFSSGTFLMWNGTSLPTTIVSSTQLMATITANLIAQIGSASITASNGNQITNALMFTITAPPPVITSLAPSSLMAGGTVFTLTVNGTGFLSGAVVSFNTSQLATAFVSATQVTAVVPAAMIAQPGLAQITVTNPTGQASNPVPLSITAPVPVIISLSPVSITAGGAAFSLSVAGTGFFPGATVFWNGATLNTSFVSGTQVVAAVTADLILQPAIVPITASNAGTAMSNAVNFTVKPPVPAITSISPSSVAAGGPAFTLNINGTNFFSGATVSLGGTALTTTFVSSTQLTAAVPANLIAQPGKVPITAANAGTASSNAVTLTITPPTPTITSISPSTVTAGGPAFTLNITGTNFQPGVTVSLSTSPTTAAARTAAFRNRRRDVPADSTTLTTTFVSDTQLTAQVPANLIAQAGAAQITAANTGGAASNAVALAIVNPIPILTSISPSTIAVGGPAFTLTLNGSNFVPGATVQLQTASLPTTFVNATQLTTLVPASLVQTPLQAAVSVANPGSPPSNVLLLTVTSPAPTLTSISPVSARQGDPTFTLSLTGTGFVQASVAQWNGAPLSTTFISSTQLTATVDAGRLILPATASVTVVNPAPDGSPVTSNALTFTINAVMPVISSISPTSATAGDSALTLTVNGNGFFSQTTIQWNTTMLTTHFVSAGQLTADVPAALLAQPGSVSVTAVNPGNNVSTVVTFTINPKAPPVITSLSKTSATAGDAAFTLTVTGTGFISGAVVNFGTTALATTFVSATQLTATVPANLLLTPATIPIAVEQAGATSNTVSFTVNLPAPPSLRLTPPTATGPAQQPTIDFGLNTGYPIAMSGTVTLTFVSSATVPADDPAIQFSSGGRTLTFTVPANTTTLPALQISTGTVAGTITLTVTLTAAGVNVTPPGSTATITIAKAAPVILAGKVTLTHGSGTLQLDITAFSTTRDMTQAVFHLNAAPGAIFTSSDITVPLSALFTTWYQSAASATFGSQFTYTQSFTVSGNTNQVQSVTVTLSNSAGTSVSMTSN